MKLDIDATRKDTRMKPTRVIIVVKDGVVSGACSDDPTLDIAVLDYDDWKTDTMHKKDTNHYQELSDEADQLHAVY